MQNSMQSVPEWDHASKRGQRTYPPAANRSLRIWLEEGFWEPLFADSIVVSCLWGRSWPQKNTHIRKQSPKTFRNTQALQSPKQKQQPKRVLSKVGGGFPTGGRRL